MWKMKKSGILTPSAQALAGKTLLRRPLLLFLLLAVSFAGMLGALLLHWQIDDLEKEWEESQRNIAVKCTVTNAFGRSSNALNMEPYLLETLCSGSLSAWVRDVNAQKEWALDIPANSFQRRILSFDSDPMLDAASGASITLLEGWAEEDFRGTQPICLVPEGTELTQDADGNYYITIQPSFFESQTLQVIGVVTGGPENTYYVPYRIQNADGNITQFTADSCSFAIADAGRLEEARAVLRRYFTDPTQYEADRKTSMGLLIHDEAFLAVKNGVQTNLAMLRLLLPLLIAGMGVIGFLATLLFARGRKKEFAVMRCIGLHRRTVFALVLEEQILVVLVAALLTAAAALLLPGELSGAAWGSTAGVALTFLIGSAIATLRITSINTMQLMKTEG